MRGESEAGVLEVDCADKNKNPTLRMWGNIGNHSKKSDFLGFSGVTSVFRCTRGDFQYFGPFPTSGVSRGKNGHAHMLTLK